MFYFKKIKIKIKQLQKCAIERKILYSYSYMLKIVPGSRLPVVNHFQIRSPFDFNNILKSKDMIGCPLMIRSPSVVNPCEKTNNMIAFEIPSASIDNWTPTSSENTENIEMPLSIINEAMEMNKTKTDKRSRYAVFFLKTRRHRQYPGFYDAYTQTRRAAFATGGVDIFKLQTLPFGETHSTDNYIQKDIFFKQKNFRSPCPTPYHKVDPKVIPDDPTARKGGQ